MIIKEERWGYIILTTGKDVHTNSGFSTLLGIKLILLTLSVITHVIIRSEIINKKKVVFSRNCVNLKVRHWGELHAVPIEGTVASVNRGLKRSHFILEPMRQTLLLHRETSKTHRIKAMVDTDRVE